MVLPPLELAIGEALMRGGGHYVRTLWHWGRHLESRGGDAIADTGPRTYRVWRLYMGRRRLLSPSHWRRPVRERTAGSDMARSYRIVRRRDGPARRRAEGRDRAPHPGMRCHSIAPNDPLPALCLGGLDRSACGFGCAL